MNLTAELLAAKRTDYPEVQPLSAVESEHIEMLPETFERGGYGWRDAEWVVQWYYRRFLGAYPDGRRRDREAAYDENSFEAVQAAISGAVAAEETADRMAHLTDLAGVDVPVAAAFLQFIDPKRYVVVDERLWTVLQRAGAIDTAYPDPPTVAEYERYLDRFRAVADRHNESLWDCYRALWVLGEDVSADAPGP